MAKIWPAYDGFVSNTGEPWAVLPLADAIRLLELRPEHFLTDLSWRSNFGDSKQNLAWRGFPQVVAEIGVDDRTAEWEPGFYRSPVPPSQIFYRLLARRIEEEIGAAWRVQLEEGRDADGERAVWAWISLKEDAPTAEWTRENRQNIETVVRRMVAESGISDWVFVRFLKEAEERAAS